MESMPLLVPELLALGGAVSVLAVVLGISILSQPNPIQQRLDQFGVRMRNIEELELQQPFRERILRPLMRSLSQVIVRRTPQSTLDQIRRDLLIAGSPGGFDVRDFLGLKGLGALAVGGAYFLFFARNTSAFQALLIGTGATVAGYYLPNLWLRSKIQTRQREIQRALPDALDLLTICVEAGLGFDAALHKVTEKWSNALAAEFGRVLAEIRMGKSRRDALRDMVARTEVGDVATFVAAIIQADQLGVSVSRVLTTQSEQMRMRRRQRAEELAQQAPVKIVPILVLLIFPSLFVVVLGPALPAMIGGLGGK